METVNPLWLFFTLTLGVVVLPGLDMALVTGSALTSGLRGGLAAVVGIVVGGAVHVVINATGVSALLMHWPAAFNALLVAGSLYMVWIGLGIWRSAGKPSESSPSHPIEAGWKSHPQASSWAIFLRGMLNCLLNPKAYAFMLAVFPVFLRTPARGIAAQALVLGTIIAANQIVVYGAVAGLAARAKNVSAPAQGANTWLARVVGACLLIAAGLTLITAWQPA